MKRTEDSRTQGFAGFLRRGSRPRATTSPHTRALRFFVATALAVAVGVAIAFAATPHKAPAATGATQTSVALQVAKQTRQGRRTTMTATVSTPAPAAGAPAPSGTVSFSDRGKPIDGCSSQKLDKLTATCEVTFWDTGQHPISAEYGGDAAYAAATSSTSNMTVMAVPVKGDITARTNWTFRFTPTYTSVLQLTVTGLYEGSDVVLGCQGKGCPFRSEDFPVLRPKICSPNVPALSCPPNNFFLTKYFAGRRLAVGAELTIRVSHPSYIGKYYSFTVQARKSPVVRIACLAPGSTLPGVGCRPRPDQHIPG
jgi:Bacterial Ig-like domain (group 3)